MMMVGFNATFDIFNDTSANRSQGCPALYVNLNALVLAVFLFNTFVGLAGNLLCLLAFRHQLVVKKESPYLHQCSVVIADTLAIFMGTAVYYHDKAWDVFCIYRYLASPSRAFMLIFAYPYPLSLAAHTASSLLLLLACVDRIQAVSNIVDYPSVDQKRRAKWGNFLSYTFSLIITLYPYGYDVVALENAIGQEEYVLRGRRGPVSLIMRYLYITVKLAIMLALCGALAWLSIAYKKSKSENFVEEIPEPVPDQGEVMVMELGVPARGWVGEQVARNVGGGGVTVMVREPQPVAATALMAITATQGVLTVLATAAQAFSLTCWALDLNLDASNSIFETCVLSDVGIWLTNSTAINFNFIFYLVVSSKFRDIVLKILKLRH